MIIHLKLLVAFGCLRTRLDFMNPVEHIDSVHKTAGKSQIYSHSVQALVDIVAFSYLEFIHFTQLVAASRDLGTKWEPLITLDVFNALRNIAHLVDSAHRAEPILNNHRLQHGWHSPHLL